MLSKALRTELAAARTALIKEKSLESPEYLQKLIEDIENIADIEAPGLNFVCKKLNIRDDIVIASQESNIGKAQEEAFIRDFLSLYGFHPYKAEINENLDESL